MQIGKICKTVGYGGILCSALVFAKPCHGDNQFIFDTTNAMYSSSTTPLIINQYTGNESQFVNQNADVGALLFQNGSALNINVAGISLANALSLYNGVDFTMAQDAGTLALAGGVLNSTPDGSSILVQRESGYTSYWDTNRNNAVDYESYTQVAANTDKAITTNIKLESAAGQTITGQYGIKIVGLRSASGGHGSTNDATDYAGDTVNITLGGTGENSLSTSSGAIYRDNLLGIVNATVEEGSTWGITGGLTETGSNVDSLTVNGILSITDGNSGSSTVDSLSLGSKSTLNLLLQGTPTNTSGGSVMTVNTNLTLPTTTAATVGLQWQKVSNPANADTINQSYLVLPNGATGDWSKLKINLANSGTPSTTGNNLKLDEKDRILLISGNYLNSGTEFPESNLLFNGLPSVQSTWFTDGDESKLQLTRENNNLYATVVSDVFKVSHYSYPAATTKRVVIYPRFANTGDIPGLNVDGTIDCACGSDYAYRSHLNIDNDLSYTTATDKAAVTIMNNYTLNGEVNSNQVTGTWDDANGLDNLSVDQACDVLVTIPDGKKISRTQSTANATAITLAEDKYVPAIRIVSAGSGEVIATSTSANAYGVDLVGTSFAAHSENYAWGSYQNYGDSVTGYAYRFEAPITATAAAGKNAYGIYIINNDSNEASQAKVLITKNVSATGGTENYAVYGNEKVEFHFGGGTQDVPNEIKTIGDLSGDFFVDQYAGLNLSAATAITGKFTNNGTVDVNAATTFSDLFTNNVSSNVIIEADTTFNGCINVGTMTVDGVATITGEVLNNGTVDVNAVTTFSNLFTNNENSNIKIGANATFSEGYTNSGAITVDGDSEIIGNLTNDGAIAVNADAKFVGSLTGTGKITVGSASELAFFDCSSDGCSLALAPSEGSAITCADGHNGIMAIKTHGTADNFGKSGNVAFEGQSTSNLLLAGKGGTVNGAINGFDKLIFGYHLGAPELNSTTLFGSTNDNDTNAWTLNGAITGKDIIVRHGNITAKGAVNLTGQLYVLGCNFCTKGIVKIAGGEYSHEEMLSFDRNSTVEISNDADGAEITALTVDGVQITPDTLSSILSSDKKQFLADIVLGSSAEKGGAQLVVDSDKVTLNSYTVDDKNIGILAIGNGNDIYLNYIPAINYYSNASDSHVSDYENCYAIKGNETTTLNVRKLSESSTLNGKVLVGAMSIDATGETLTLTNDNGQSGEGELHTNKLTVDLVSFEGWNLVETDIPVEAKLEVANLAPLSGSEIDVEIVHIGKAVDGDKIHLVKCGECNALFKAKQPFLREYAISYDTDGYVATVTKSMTHEQAARKLDLDTSYGRFLDSDIKMKDELYWNQIKYGSGEQAYTTIANWSARSDHMEKARITSSMMSVYNEAMFARRGVHNFNQGHKLISWISGFGDWFKQDGVKYLGAKANTYGIIAGADYQLNDKWLFSLSCGYANSDVKLNGKEFYRNNGSGHQDSFVSSTAMTYKNKLRNGEFSATGLFTSAFVHHKYNYKLQINENKAWENESGHEKYHGFALSLGLDADWMFNYKDTAVKYGPIVQVGFDRTSQDGHNTTCSNSTLSFSTKEANVNSLWSILGAKVEYDCTLQQKKVNMYCQAGWKFQYLRNGANVRRNMLNSSTEFTATGTYVDKSMLALKLGVSLFATESFNLGVEYGLDYNSKVHSNRANVEMSYMF